MTKPTAKIKKLSFQCARCFKKDADKLAWFFSSNSLWADSLLCRVCFKDALKTIPTKSKIEQKSKKYRFAGPWMSKVIP